MNSGFAGDTMEIVTFSGRPMPVKRANSPSVRFGVSVSPKRSRPSGSAPKWRCTRAELAALAEAFELRHEIRERQAGGACRYMSEIDIRGGERVTRDRRANRGEAHDPHAEHHDAERAAIGIMPMRPGIGAVQHAERQDMLAAPQVRREGERRNAGIGQLDGAEQPSVEGEHDGLPRRVGRFSHRGMRLTRRTQSLASGGNGSRRRLCVPSVQRWPGSASPQPSMM